MWIYLFGVQYQANVDYVRYEGLLDSLNASDSLWLNIEEGNFSDAIYETFTNIYTVYGWNE